MVLTADEFAKVLEMEQAVGLGADAHRDQGVRERIAHLANATKDEIAAGPFVEKIDPVTQDVTYHLA